MADMELKVQEITLPDIIKFNYEELKNELAARCEMYETAVYTDDSIKQAKADKAMLNKLKKALNDERIRREKEYMQPFNEFKSKVNELIGIIDKPVSLIDMQVKAFEEHQKQEKQDKIIEIWKAAENKPEWISLAMIEDAKWLNASCSLKSIQEEVNFAISNINANIAVLEKLPDFSFEAIQTYKSCLDLQKAINEANRLSDMAKQKAEMEAKKEAERIAAEEAAKKAAEEAAKQAEEVQKEETAVVEAALPFTDEGFAEELPEAFPMNPPATPDTDKEWKYMQVNVNPDEYAKILQFLETNGIEFFEL